MILFLILDGLLLSFFSLQMKLLTHKLDMHKPHTQTCTHTHKHTHTHALLSCAC